MLAELIYLGLHQRLGAGGGLRNDDGLVKLFFAAGTAASKRLGGLVGLDAVDGTREIARLGRVAQAVGVERMEVVGQWFERADLLVVQVVD